MDKFTIQDLELFYGDFRALKNINLNIKANEIEVTPKSWTLAERN